MATVGEQPFFGEPSGEDLRALLATSCSNATSTKGLPRYLHRHPLRSLLHFHHEKGDLVYGDDG